MLLARIVSLRITSVRRQKHHHLQIGHRHRLSVSSTQLPAKSGSVRHQAHRLKREMYGHPSAARACHGVDWLAAIFCGLLACRVSSIPDINLTASQGGQHLHLEYSYATPFGPARYS
jgi:hypothetical protein